VTVSFEETVALITGATSGIGKATALSRTTPATSTASFFPDVPLDLGKQQAAVQRGEDCGGQFPLAGGRAHLTAVAHAGQARRARGLMQELIATPHGARSVAPTMSR
jgi:NAD(P)-dependent dehydrogenase (short-subunit alcohol dehydrogenase family)